MAGEVEDLMLAVERVNALANHLKSAGWTVQFSVPGIDYGDRVDLQVEWHTPYEQPKKEPAP